MITQLSRSLNCKQADVQCCCFPVSTSHILDICARVTPLRLIIGFSSLLWVTFCPLAWGWKKKEVFLSSAWKIEKFVLLLQVCRGWNEAFHMPELWRCFEFELNQPASSYLKATHPDLIKQIIKRHSDHLQYVSFKVRKRGGQFEVTAVQWWSAVDFYVLPNSQCHFLCVLPGGQQQRVCRSSVRHPLSAGELFFENSGAHLHSQAQLHGDA